MYAITRDGGNLGFLKGPGVAIANRIAQFFAASGYKLQPVKSDPTAFGIYKDTLTSTDAALLSKCTK